AAPPVGDSSLAIASRKNDLRARRVAWLTLAIVLIAGVPLFICMAPSWDSTVYDLCARNLLRGGVHYRDTFDTNLPRVVWIHVALRWLLGWRSETLQIVDLIFFTGIVFLFLQFLRQQNSEPNVPNVGIWTAVAFFSYYLSLPDNCHCQRDTWMMLFALAALFLRLRQVRRLCNDPAPRNVLGWALVEGLCWGAG